jgi:CubicO group peptidase (beta-lactamase class C family)
LSYDVPDTISRGAGGPLLTLDENLRRLGELQLAFMPGSAWLYGMSIDVLGGIIATINGSDLEGAVARYVTTPLGMADTHFHLTDPARLTTPYGDAPGTPVRLPEPHWVANNNSREPFSPRRAYERDAAQSGGGGMAGTAGDFMKLLVAVQGDFLTPAGRALALTNQIGDLPGMADGLRWSMLGTVIDDRALARHPAPDGTVHWGGSWGNHGALDPASGRTLAVFTNTMFEGFNGRFRDDIAAAVFA